MSSKLCSPFLLLSLLVFLALVLKSNPNIGRISMVTEVGGSKDNNAPGQIAIYWGQDERENTLVETCSTGNYEIVIITFLSKFGSGQEPELSLGGHCNPSNDRSCQRLSKQIQTCQSRGIKIFLSIGGPPGSYSISSTNEAKAVSDYLWNSFLGGSSASFNRPFGAAVLDGIDFDVRGGNLTNHYDIIPIQLSPYSKQLGKKVYFSVSTPCLYPPKRLSGMISNGLVDYAWIQFYNVYSSPDQCEYDPENENSYKEAWKWWASKPVGKLFFGTLGSYDAGLSGYIMPNVFTSKVLPYIKGTKNYGGVVIWNKLEDDRNGFSSSIKTSV